MRWNRIRVGMEMPYPLDSETAAAVEEAKRHHVLTGMLWRKATTWANG